MSRDYADLALSAYVSELAEGRRVLWVGDHRGGGPEHLAPRARGVRVLDPAGGPRGRGRVRVAELRAGPLSLRPESFGLVVVPDAEVLGDALVERLGDLRRALSDDGVLVVGVRAQEGGAGAFEALFEAMSDELPEVATVGIAPFAGRAVARLGDDGAARDVVVDGSVVEEPEAPTQIVAVGGRERPSLPSYAVVQVPAGPPAMPLELTRPDASRVEALEDRLAEAREAVERERDLRREAEARRDDADAARREAAQAAAAARDALERARAAPAPDREGPSDGDAAVAAAEHQALERALRERAAEVRELRAEVARRGTLVRDVVEQAREAESGGGSPEREAIGRAERDAAVARALDAEARVLELELSLDELAGRLARREVPELDELRTTEALLGGAVRGLRSRVAEVEELRAQAEARASLYRGDLERALEQRRLLEVKLAELQDQLELEVVRAQGDPAAADAEQLRASLAEQRDQARADTLRLTAYVAGLETRIEGMRIGYERRIAELLEDAGVRGARRTLDADIDLLSEELVALRGERDGLRLRLDDREQALASREAAAARLADVEAERDALSARIAAVEEAGLEDRLEVALADAERLQAQLDARAAAALSERLPSADLTAKMERLEHELERLRGEHDAALARLEDRDATVAELESKLSVGGESGLRLELDDLRSRQAVLRAQAEDAEEARASVAARLAELEESVTSRDALVTRLQMDLTEEEQANRVREDRVAQLAEENQRLRQAVVAASEAAEAAQAALEARGADGDEELGAASEAAAPPADELLRDTRDALARLLINVEHEPHRQTEITATGIDAPTDDERDALRAELEQVRARATEEARLRELNAELERAAQAHDMIMRSLTAQLEERNDRIAALERRVSDAAAPGLGEDTELRERLAALQDRVAELDEALERERDRGREAGGAGAVWDEVQRMRSAVEGARGELEAIFGRAQERRDEELADRVGSLLSTLGKL